MHSLLLPLLTFMTITMSEAEFDLIQEQVEKLVAIEAASPIIQFDSIKIVIDKKGRIFIPETLNGSVELSYLRYTFSADISNSVAYAKEPSGFFWSHRFKLGAYFDPTLKGGFKDKWAPAVLYEPFRYKSFGANVSVGTSLIGGAISWSFVRNVDLFLVGGVQLDNGQPGGTVGVCISPFK